MKAICWHGRHDVRFDTVPDPKIEDPRDVIIQIKATAICGSDLHIYDGYIPGMKAGDILGHEPLGEVVEVGAAVEKLAVGDRVVVPFTISCGDCFFCERTLFSLCDNSNPNSDRAREAMGQSPAGVYGYSHLLGGFAGSQAEYMRVPYADVGPIKIPEGVSDEEALFLSDILPTAYMAAEQCDIEDGDTVAVWGCGPVGQLAIKCAWLLGAERVIAIDRVVHRLSMARMEGKAETINFSEQDVYRRLMDMTNGRGPDRCIDAVGAEAHASKRVDSLIDRAKDAVHLATDHPHALGAAIMCCRKGGTVSVPGVYVASMDLPFGAAMHKALTIRTGQTHVQRYLEPLLRRVEEGEIEPGFVITHRVSLRDVPDAYAMFRDKKDGCVKVVVTP